MTLLFIIRHSARITEFTLHNNGGSQSWNIEEKITIGPVYFGYDTARGSPSSVSI